jgi:outer membrane protein
MRHLILILVALLLPSLALAQGKIAVLDVQAAILNTDVAQKRFKELRAQPTYDGNMKELEKLRKEYEELVKQVQKDLVVMSAEQKEAQRKKIEDKRGDIEHVARKLQMAEQELAQGLMQDLGAELQSVVTELIKSEGIGLLLDRKAVMHADNAYNITAKVTERLNKAK